MTVSAIFFAALCAVLTIAGAWSAEQQNDSSLKILNPGQTPGLPAGLPSKMPLQSPDARANFFTQGPTDEARDRLRALDRQLNERQNFRTLTQQDVLSYQKENHEIALSYLRALLRAKISEWVQGSRDYFQRERDRKEARGRAATERSQRSLASLTDEKETREEASIAEEEHSSSESGLSQVLTRVTKVVERLTNDGVTASTPAGQALMKLDTQNTTFSASVATSVANVGVSYRLRPAHKPLPFSGAPGDPNEERLHLSAGGSVPVVGVQGAVGYQYLRRSIACSLSRQITGGLAAHVARSWDYGVAAAPTGRTTSLAEISYSLVF